MRSVVIHFLCVPVVAGTALGDLRFENVSEYPTGGGSTGVFTADFDGDTDVDIAIANRYVDTVTILYNDGFGGVSSSVDVPTGDNPRYVEGFDYDGDGDVDLCTPDYDGNTITILENDGVGSFSIVQQIPMFKPPFLWIDDLDQDGNEDIIVLHWDENANDPETNAAVMQPVYSNGDGTFELGPTASIGVQPRGGASADVNGDGLLDVVTADTYSRTISIVLSTGSRTWEEAIQIEVWPKTPRYILLNDFDGDGDADISMLDKLGDRFLLFANDGSANFSLTELEYTHATPHSMVSLDVDGDGDLDFIVSHVGSDVQLILYNDGTGHIASRQSITITGGAADIGVNDLNADGLFDIVVATINQSSQGASVLLQKECLLCKGGEACPPTSSDVNLTIETFTNIKIELLGETYSGNALEYIITSLPDEGELQDSNGFAINTTPYYLPTNIVSYIPKEGFVGLEFFHYRVNDCLPSNQSIVTLQVNPMFPDECDSALQVFNGYTTVSTVAATDSLDEYDTVQCSGTNLGEMRNDIWLTYYACDSGELFIDTCGLFNFDTDIVVYKDSCCDLNQVACNGDTAGCNGNTTVTVDIVEPDVNYFIRIGGVEENANGDGVVFIEGSSTGCVDSCIVDVTYDGIVGVNDLLFVLSQWGSNCSESDFNIDGIVNVVDLLAVISSWGPCSN